MRERENQVWATGYPSSSYWGNPGPGATPPNALWPASAAAPLRAGPRLARGSREPRAPRALEELGAGAKVSSQLWPRAPPPPPTPARGLGPALPRSSGPPPEAGPGWAAPAVSLWRVEPPSAPGRPSASPRPRSRPRPPVGLRVAAVGPSPGGTRGSASCPPQVPGRRGCARGPGTCSARPRAGAQGQDESDSVLREDQHRGALQGRPAARPRAHSAGAAAVPEDPGPGEGRRRGGRGARLSRGSLSLCPRPRTCPAPWTRWRFLWGSYHPQRLVSAARSHNFHRLI